MPMARTIYTPAREHDRRITFAPLMSWQGHTRVGPICKDLFLKIPRPEDREAPRGTVFVCNVIRKSL